MKVDTRSSLLRTALVLAATLAPQVHGAEIPDLIIRNVHIIGTGSQTEHTRQPDGTYPR
jgi:hypothetical protein